MIKINLEARNGKVYTSYDELDITLNDTALIIREMEKIKLDLLEKEWKKELEIKIEETKNEK